MTLSSMTQQLMLPQLAAGIVEQALNYFIQRSEGVEPYLHKLNGKVLLLTFKQGGHWFLLFSSQRIDLLSDYAGEVDCKVITDVDILWTRPQKQQLSAMLNRRQIILQGDLQVLQDTVALFERLEKDPAELLAPFIGDIAAYSLTSSVQKMQRQLKARWQTAQRHWGERLSEEWQVVAPSLALVDFYDQVAILAEDLQRLEAKVERLTGKL